MSNVTGAMMGKQFRVGNPATQVPRWRTVALSIAGKRPITIALSSDRHGCAALTAAMLGMDEDGLDVAMIDDFMRELVNMTAGQIKRELSLDQALGLPRMIDGDAVFAGSAAWNHVVLAGDSINLVISLFDGLV